MALTNKGYKTRLIDDKIDSYLKIFGAISIDGPKWCGKTWTSLNHANSVEYIADPKDNFNKKRLAELNVENVLNGEHPALIDEWQLVPSIWDAVRFKCDENSEKGKYILTGSATQNSNLIHHSGAGRISKLRMYTMSLYESGESSGNVSIKDLFNNNVKTSKEKQFSLEEIANLIIRGGWPENINNNAIASTEIAKNYIRDIIDKDIYTIDGKQRNKEKFMMLLRSLARNESTLANNTTLIKDIIENEDDSINKETVSDYLNVLDKLYLIENQTAFNPKVRSRENVGKSYKRHFTDPSLVCALLNLNSKKLISDLNTFGLLFEALVERDLRIYMEYNQGELRHFRNNDSGEEVDAIVINEDGEYGAIEIKLGNDRIDEAKESLLKFYNKAVKKPKFMAIITSAWSNVVQDKETGIYILPITALKP